MFRIVTRDQCEGGDKAPQVTGHEGHSGGFHRNIALDPQARAVPARWWGRSVHDLDGGLRRRNADRPDGPARGHAGCGCRRRVLLGLVERRQGWAAEWETFHLVELRQLLERNWHAGDKRAQPMLPRGSRLAN
jgi:hypothetical protein